MGYVTEVSSVGKSQFPECRVVRKHYSHLCALWMLEAALCLCDGPEYPWLFGSREDSWSPWGTVTLSFSPAQPGEGWEQVLSYGRKWAGSVCLQRAGQTAF